MKDFQIRGSDHERRPILHQDRTVTHNPRAMDIRQISNIYCSILVNLILLKYHDEGASQAVCQGNPIPLGEDRVVYILLASKPVAGFCAALLVSCEFLDQDLVDARIIRRWRRSGWRRAHTWANAE